MVLKTNERIDYLMQYNLKIIQSPQMFSFSLDAVLLGDFAHIRNRDDLKIIDLCAGNGAVTLMLSQKTESPICGVEIQKDLADMAQRSVRMNDLDDQVTMIQKDLKTIGTEHYDSVDVITCNPPYFPIEVEGDVNPNEHLAIARHEIHLTLDDLLFKMSKLLKMNAKAYLVYRPDRFLELMDKMRDYQIMPKRVRFIYPNEETPANMVLVEGIKHGSEAGFKMLPPLYVHTEDGSYRPEVRKILYGED